VSTCLSAIWQHAGNRLTLAEKKSSFLVFIDLYLRLICVDRRNILSAGFVGEAPSHGTKNDYSRKVT
jgi:hypothetical protein